MHLIKVPCSSANIGPGFDVIGLALSMYLELRVSVDETSPADASNNPLNCTVTYTGVGAEDIDLNPANNLLTRTALYVLRCHNQRAFPPQTHVHIHNPIPLGRGLGSSGAAVVAGVLLGNVVGKLNLSQPRLLDFCLMVERHPDNVAAALYGGFVGTYLNELDPDDMARKEVPLSEVLPQPAGGVDTGLTPPIPPENIGHYRRFDWAKEIKALAIIPDFEVSTAKAREVLPKSYTRQDMIFNLQRLALLTTVLSDSPPNPDLIYSAMQDKIHQPYRKTLIPALPAILSSMSPTSHKGLLGICLSGAGPTILALATENFDAIAGVIVQHFKDEGITCEWKVLEPAEDGATIREVPGDVPGYRTSLKTV
ncbi:homoserine kinase, variant [Exophiala oligosperma]|uniref:Homoserine kinase n=2 Tax=Chaetothyriales TaxID=34395 RepID=A0A0D2B522_9EURO|nr:homoserine kinase [Exophiala oligosperma]XP_016267568.1 homoserine kinase, variant [Exophiala oligosperma]KAJ9626639.1 Trihydroxynaphthalene reductase [Knufia peltigerae]KIW47351.1 homoserine kinase [Exophiala oligosperma]KIW47352.1 homoserine kinase, variant [Exophiala oligosperma]